MTVLAVFEERNDYNFRVATGSEPYKPSVVSQVSIAGWGRTIGNQLRGSGLAAHIVARKSSSNSGTPRVNHSPKSLQDRLNTFFIESHDARSGRLILVANGLSVGCGNKPRLMPYAAGC